MLRSLYQLGRVEWPWQASLLLGLAFYVPAGVTVGFLLFDQQNQRACTGFSSLKYNTLAYEARLVECLREGRTLPVR